MRYLPTLIPSLPYGRGIVSVRVLCSGPVLLPPSLRTPQRVSSTRSGMAPVLPVLTLVSKAGGGHRMGQARDVRLLALRSDPEDLRVALNVRERR
jgi:hypothetical protein